MRQPRVSRDLCSRIARHFRTRPHSSIIRAARRAIRPIHASRIYLASILLDTAPAARIRPRRAVQKNPSVLVLIVRFAAACLDCDFTFSLIIKPNRE